jgi:hypothetical protein
MVSLVFLLFILTALASLSTNIWLSKWTDRSKKETLSSNHTSTSMSKIHGLTIYTILGCSHGNKFKKISSL